MPKNPLVEVFGFPVGNMSREATIHREGRLCPYHNSSGLRCTKNSATDPLGVCTVVNGENVAITCPVRFRQDFLIVEDAAKFFFPIGTRYEILTEVRLNDINRKSAGNIDIVLVAFDAEDRIIDFGALEVQAVYISGNVSTAFKAYMQNPTENHAMEWPSKNYPKPDYLSSSRKRLAPQLIFKGGILNRWGKKLAVAVQRPFFDQLPALAEVDVAEAEIAWLVYDMKYDQHLERYRLAHSATRYTRFKDALDTITTAEPGEVGEFVDVLKHRIGKGKIMGTPPKPELPPVVEPSMPINEQLAGEEEHLYEDDDIVGDEE